MVISPTLACSRAISSSRASRSRSLSALSAPVRTLSRHSVRRAPARSDPGRPRRCTIASFRFAEKRFVPPARPRRRHVPTGPWIPGDRSVGNRPSPRSRRCTIASFRFAVSAGWPPPFSDHRSLGRRRWCGTAMEFLRGGYIGGFPARRSGWLRGVPAAMARGSQGADRGGNARTRGDGSRGRRPVRGPCKPGLGLAASCEGRQAGFACRGRATRVCAARGMRRAEAGARGGGRRRRARCPDRCRRGRDPARRRHVPHAYRRDRPCARGAGTMMPAHKVRILVATRPVDVRKGHDGLAALVQSALQEDPFTGTVFVFRAKRADRLKILFWDDEPCRAIGPSDNGEWAGDGLQASGGDDLHLARHPGWRDDAEPGAAQSPVRRAGLAPGQGAGRAPAGCGRVNQAAGLPSIASRFGVYSEDVGPA